jgi:hypothetical protein
VWLCPKAYIIAEGQGVIAEGQGVPIKERAVRAW